jgi:alcohol dehydrogenase
MPASPSALVLESPRHLVRHSFARPEVGDDDGLLRVEACGLCGTDHEQYTGDLPAGYAFVPGHEVIGVIDAVGPAAAARWGVQPGDRVAVEVFMSCRSCPACLAGETQRCRRHGLRDMYGYIPIDKPPALWGGYADYQYLAPDSVLHPVPVTLDPVIATMFNPLGAGIRWAVTVPGTSPGDVVAILGPGIRGLCSVAAAKRAGAGFVMVTGVGRRDSARLALGRSFGADLAVDVSSEDPAAALKKATGGLADIVVDVTAKAPAALAQAISIARPGGTVVFAGTRGSAETPGFWPDLIVYKELKILGALGVDSRSYQAALAMLSSGDLPFADLPRRCEPLANAESLLQVMSGAGDADQTAPVHAVLIGQS